MAELHVIAPTITPEIEKLRVGAYVRVSTDSEDQENSFLTQYDYYSNLIQSKEEWEFVDMYADEGITGTDMKKRDDFNRMVEDCQDGRIDLILTKSISRFARNTYDCISTVRELKRYGANVFFEKEGIDTRNMSSEVELTMMSSFAQEESISISKNITVGFTHKMMDGTFIYSKVGYGFRKEGTQIVIDEYEAKNIRWIFEMCIQGKTIYEITDALIKAGVRKTDGTTDWKVSAIKFIIKNRMYMGDALTRKTYSEGFPFKRKNNIGQRDQYYIRDYCPAIISRETYEQANKIMKLRKIGSAENRYEGIFKRMVFCSVCGEPMKRTAYNNGWNCHDHSGRGKNSITDDMIQQGFIACYNRLYLNRENILTPVINLSYEYNMIKMTNELRFMMQDQNVAESDIIKSIQEIASERFNAYTSSDNTVVTELIKEKILESKEQSRIKAETIGEVVQRILLAPDRTVTVKLKNGIEFVERME